MAKLTRQAPEASTSTGLLKNDDGDSYVEIGKGGLRRVTVRTYKKSVQIDIRECVPGPL